jgi:protein involved in sex pheromone biosynthesis
MATFQATRLDAKLLLGISPAQGLHSNYYSRITPADFASSQARGLHTNNYSTWLIWFSYLEGYTRKSIQMMAFTNTEAP